MDQKFWLLSLLAGGKFVSLINLFLCQDNKRSVKGIWGIIFSLPVIAICMLTRNPQVIVTYTGGICGTFILLLFPVMIVLFARRHESQQALAKFQVKQTNFNASPFQSMFWVATVIGFALVTLFFVCVGIIEGHAG